MVELNDELKGYCVGKGLAKDLCFAMARAPLTADVAVTEIRGYGWLVECECEDRRKALKRMEVLLGKGKAAKVNWV